jgi:hypothetical protein
VKNAMVELRSVIDNYVPKVEFLLSNLFSAYDLGKPKIVYSPKAPFSKVGSSMVPAIYQAKTDVIEIFEDICAELLKKEKTGYDIFICLQHEDTHRYHFHVNPELKPIILQTKNKLDYLLSNVYAESVPPYVLYRLVTQSGASSLVMKKEMKKQLHEFGGRDYLIMLGRFMKTKALEEGKDISKLELNKLNLPLLSPKEMETFISMMIARNGCKLAEALISRDSDEYFRKYGRKNPIKAINDLDPKFTEGDPFLIEY